MAIQPIPPFAAQLTVRQSAPVSSTEKTDAVGAVTGPDSDAPAATPTQDATAQQPAQATPSREQIDQAMTEVKRALAPVARNLQFSVDDDTGRTIIKVIDASTNEVIRQMPSEELLAITKAIDSFSGLFVKQKA